MALTVTDATPTPEPGEERPAGAPSSGRPAGGRGRSELGAFLRSRRERVTPADVGLAPGVRRRTPGLRREEVAQLAGIGVTWYTWLEQGRPINASVQVLDAIARTLRLDAAERAHLYRLAAVPGVPDSGAALDTGLEPEIQTILDGLGHLAACVYSARYDVLAWNAAFAALFPSLVAAPVERRNSLWHIFTAPGCCCRFVNRETEMPRMVAMLRAAFGRHLDDPAWTRFVDELAAASPEFARMWAGHDVAQPDTRTKIFQHHRVGQVRLTATTLAVTASSEAVMTVYTPVDDDSRVAVARLVADPEPAGCGRDHWAGWLGRES